MLTDIIYFHVSHKYISAVFNNVLFSGSFAKFVDIIIGVTRGKFSEGEGQAVVKKKKKNRLGMKNSVVFPSSQYIIHEYYNK